MRTLELIVEKQDGHLWGRVEGHPGDFMPTGQGKTMEKLCRNVKDSIEDYVAHEGKKDKFWSKISVNEIHFHVQYDLQAFFHIFSFLNLTEVAKIAGINRSLLNQYTAGIKYPSEATAKKIGDAVHQIAREMGQVSIYA
ncbi:MAG: XRE family transcriptional regulator [Chitinophagaceae bacterium]|jgi:hypothetical protein|nr:MAG: XRE family transcriptional regulator [Chitinophagaceae bacterium]